MHIINSFIKQKKEILYLSLVNILIKNYEKINKGIKTLNKDEENKNIKLIKNLTYISKLNKNQKEMNNMTKMLMKNLNQYMKIKI